MASLRIPAPLRNVLHLGSRQRAHRASTDQQRRWARVHDVRFLGTAQAERTVLEKYREKLDAKARREGHADIDGLRKAYADKIHEVRSRDASVPPLEPTTTAVSKGTPPPGPMTAHAATVRAAETDSPTPSPSRSATGVRPLSAILDLPKARALPIAELTAIWRLRHAADARALCAVVPQHTYEAMEAQARRHPQFVLPVPHAERGAEMHFLQWTFDPATATSTVLFTQLAEYKARGEFAVPHTTVTHHLDLLAEKRVALMQGTVAPDRGIKPEDARWLVMCLQRFYGGWDGQRGEEDALGRERAEERRRLLEYFGKGDARFSVEKLMEEAERMG